MAVTVKVAKDQMPAVTFLDPFFWVTWKGRLLCGFTTESQAKTAAKALGSALRRLQKARACSVTGMSLASTEYWPLAVSDAGSFSPVIPISV